MGMHDEVGAAIRQDAPGVEFDDSIATAVATLKNSGGNALVVKSGGELVGILTAMDMLHSINRGDDPQTNTVAQAMTPCELITSKAAKTPCVQLDEGESVANALLIMQEADITILLLARSDGGVKGLDTLRDVLALALG
jgi:predicted transcriptional regulator